MISTKSLLVVVLLAFYIQNIKCKNVDGELRPADILPAKTYPLATQESPKLRGLKDVWDQVKSSAISSWNFLKTVADNTRRNILKWADSTRKYVDKLEKSLAEQLQVLQNRLDNIITELLGTGKVVQECLKIERRNIRDALKAIMKKLTECVSDKMKQLTQIGGKHAKLPVNDTLFMADLDDKMGACESDQDNYEECLYMVREVVYDDMKELDNNIQKTSLESRNLADDIRETLTSCSLQNFADTSALLTSEMIGVFRCVLDSKGINEAILG